MNREPRPTLRQTVAELPHGWAVLGFAIAVTALAGLGFAYKMSEFVITILRSDIQGFGAAAVIIYLVGMVPIAMITLWAVCSGKFRNIEAPKFRHLELHEEIERAERGIWRQDHGR